MWIASNVEKEFLHDPIKIHCHCTNRLNSKFGQMRRAYSWNPNLVSKIYAKHNLLGGNLINKEGKKTRTYIPVEFASNVGVHKLLSAP